MSTTFSVQLQGGEVEQCEITPGGKIRLCVGERGGPRGSVWNLWATKNDASFYVGIRDTSGFKKWSFHGSGDWRSQWNATAKAEAKARELGHEGGRIEDQWTPSPEVGEIGWTSAFSICIRRQDLASYDDSWLPEDIVWVPPPPENAACEIHVVVVRPTGRQIRAEGMLPICCLGLADDRQVLALGAIHEIGEGLNAMIAGWTDQTKALLMHRGVEPPARSRMSVHSVRDDGHRMAWDLLYHH